MNTPNKLTILRVFLVPLFMIFELYGKGFIMQFVATLLFVLACITDWLDGYLARKNGEVTNFGKIVDPLADKMLTTAALVCLTAAQVISPWVTIVILAREFIVSGIRIAAAAEGNVIAASYWGKLKTVWQFIIIIAALLFGKHFLIDIGMWIAVALTVVSGIDYVAKNAKYLSMK